MSGETFTLIDDGQARSVTDRPEALAALAARLGRPLAIDVQERAAYLRVSARARAEQLRSLEAPDFALPDLGGRLHPLGEPRGKKVFLVAYASWSGCRLGLP